MSSAAAQCTNGLPLTGGCACGAVGYAVTAAPLTVYLCHCHDCQTRTGTAFSMGLPVPRSGFAITQGVPERRERAANSGRVSLQHHCPQCLARTHAEAEATPQIVTVRAGTLDDTSWVKPVAQMWTESAQPWAVQPHLLSYEKEPADPLEPVRAFRALGLFYISR